MYTPVDLVHNSMVVFTATDLDAQNIIFNFVGIEHEFFVECVAANCFFVKNVAINIADL